MFKEIVKEWWVVILIIVLLLGWLFFIMINEANHKVIISNIDTSKISDGFSVPEVINGKVYYITFEEVKNK